VTGAPVDRDPLEEAFSWCYQFAGAHMDEVPVEVLDNLSMLAQGKPAPHPWPWPVPSPALASEPSGEPRDPLDGHQFTADKTYPSTCSICRCLKYEHETDSEDTPAPPGSRYCPRIPRCDNPKPHYGLGECVIVASAPPAQPSVESQPEPPPCTCGNGDTTPDKCPLHKVSAAPPSEPESRREQAPGHEWKQAPHGSDLAAFGMCGYIVRYLGPPDHKPDYCTLPKAAHAAPKREAR
jgi:hypothetical protein